jgi:O-antigen/teichoic acid export membrane protein
VSDSKASYSHIIKTTSLFGGVQFLTIIISIIRTKLIAIFIGPAGMGIITLLNSAINVLSGISGLGIETSGIKHIASNYKNNDLSSVAKIAAIVKKLAVFTGILGCLLTIFLSTWLSQLTFGNSNHSFSFIFISVTLLFKQLMVGELVILQGLRRMRLLAKANFYGNLYGLVFSIPLYYYYRIDAIVPTIIVASLSSLAFSLFY